MTDRTILTAGGNPLTRAFRSLDNRDFRFLWFATVLYHTAWWMQITVLGWLILDLTDSPFMVALVGVFGWGPMLGLGLIGGMLADTFNRTTVLRATHVASVISSIILTVVLFAGVDGTWHAYGAVLVTGIGRALDQSARRALIHDILGTRDVTNALALDSAAHHGTKAIGPALAGGLIAFAGISAAYLVNSIVFWGAALLVWAVIVIHSNRAEWNLGWVSSEIGAGVRYVVSNSTILAVVLITLLVNMFLFTYVNMIPVIARDELGVGAGLMGAMTSADGVGALIGTVGVASASLITHHSRIFIIGSLAGLLCLALLSFSGIYGLSLVLIFAIGLGTAGFSTMQGAIVLLVARPEMRGRCLGVITLVIGISPLGAVILGTVADALGPLAAIRLNGFLGVFLVGVVSLWAASLRRRIPLDANVQKNEPR